MAAVAITSGEHRFIGRLEETVAPRTCAKFRSLLPYKQRVIHVRWSGEGCWIPLGDMESGLPLENATSYPAPGQFLFYPGGYSETEIIFAYGAVNFASKLGQLAGNHFMTLNTELDLLATFGKKVLWEGAQEIDFHIVD